MSYVQVNGMRGNRFPLMGALGCGCTAPQPVSGLGKALGALGLDIESAAFGASLTGAGVGGIVIGLGAGYLLGRGRRAVAANRRHRRARRRR